MWTVRLDSIVRALKPALIAILHVKDALRIVKPLARFAGMEGEIKIICRLMESAIAKLDFLSYWCMNALRIRFL